MFDYPYTCPKFDDAVDEAKSLEDVMTNLIHYIELCRASNEDMREAAENKLADKQAELDDVISMCEDYEKKIDERDATIEDLQTQITELEIKCG